MNELNLRNIIEYRDYVAVLTVDTEDNIIVGRLVNTQDIVSFHGTTIDKAKKAFHDIIDVYLDAKERIAISIYYINDNDKWGYKVIDLHNDNKILQQGYNYPNADTAENAALFTKRRIIKQLEGKENGQDKI